MKAFYLFTVLALVLSFSAKAACPNLVGKFMCTDGARLFVSLGVLKNGSPNRIELKIGENTKAYPLNGDLTLDERTKLNGSCNDEGILTVIANQSGSPFTAVREFRPIAGDDTIGFGIFDYLAGKREEAKHTFSCGRSQDL